MKTLPYLLLFITTVVRTEENQDSIPEASHHSHSHSHSTHGQHHGHKARILFKKIHVPVAIEKNVPYPVEKCVPTPMKVLVPFPYPVHKLVADPYKVLIKVPTPVYQRFPIEKVVPVPVKVPYDHPIPIRVLVPYPYPTEKNSPTLFRVPINPFSLNQIPLDFFHINQIPVNQIPENQIPIKVVQPEQGLSQYATKPDEFYNQDKSNFSPTQDQEVSPEKGNLPAPENEVFPQIDNFEKSQLYQMIMNHLAITENAETPVEGPVERGVEQKLIVSDHNFDRKPFYPQYVMHFEKDQNLKHPVTSEGNKIKISSEGNHYEGFPPSTVYEKKNNDYHQHLTENFETTKLFDQSKNE